jgi:ubiquitin-protein ligase E3 B
VTKLKGLTIGYEKVDLNISTKSSGNLFKRAIERNSTKSYMPNKSNLPWRKLESSEITEIATVCVMYHSALNNLSQLKLDILSGNANRQRN